MMKTSTKVTIGLGVAAAASVATAVVVSGKVIEKNPSFDEPGKSKKFVNETFDGNEKLLDIVEHLSDSDLDSLMGIWRRSSQAKRKFLSMGIL